MVASVRLALTISHLSGACIYYLCYEAMASEVGFEPTISFRMPEPKSGDLPISLLANMASRETNRSFFTRVRAESFCHLNYRETWVQGESTALSSSRSQRDIILLY